MFRYVFESQDCLIKGITMSGNILTFDHQSINGCEELLLMGKDLGLTFFSEENPIHVFSHNDNGTEVSFLHAHCTFAGDPLEMLQKVIVYLTQFSPALRKERLYSRA